MKKTFFALSLALASACSQAALIFTDSNEFFAKYENPTGQIDFSSYVIAGSPVQSSTFDTFHSDSFGPEVFFETRRAGDLGWAWQAVDRAKTGGNIFATDLPYTEGERIGVSTSHHSVVALFTTMGFFGWAADANGLEINDTLLLLPIGAQVESFQWGFTERPMEAPEPAPILLILAGLATLTSRRLVFRK